jgi:hypothetical protein
MQLLDDLRFSAMKLPSSALFAGLLMRVIWPACRSVTFNAQLVATILDWADNREKDARDEACRQAHLLCADDGLDRLTRFLQ